MLTAWCSRAASARAIAAELGTMRVTEQIDALESLGRSPVVAPHRAAGAGRPPHDPGAQVLANVIGIVAGWWRVKQVPADHRYRLRLRRAALLPPLRRLLLARSRRSSSAARSALISCYMGFNTKQGAEGVGARPPAAVVTSSIVVLLLAHLSSPSCCSHVIELRDVRKRFGAQVVLDGVNFTVRRARRWRCSALGHRQERAAQDTSSG